jgi:O-methyltransferase
VWLKNKWVQSLGGGGIEHFSLRLWSRLQFSALHARKKPDVVKLLWEVHQEKRSLLSAFEAFLVYSTARSQANRPGDFVEVGVYKGASAKLIASVKGDKNFHLFDTFEGLPPSSENDPGVHRQNQYRCSLESVQEYLSPYNNLHFHKGIFPDSTKGLPEAKYTFAHFDVDLYDGTVACLEYFYPRMMPGGIILSHDYGLLSGVEKAFDEFFADKPESVIEQPTTQCMVVKL